jgi:hypothetical protein
MGRPEMRELAVATDASLKPGGFGAPQGGVAADQSTRSHPRRKKDARWKKTFDRAVQDFAAHLKRMFGAQMGDDKRAREFKKYVVRALRRNLPPGPGRPPDAAVSLALELRQRGLPWDAVCEQCIPNFRGLSRGQRQLAKSMLRSKCRSRRNTARRRKNHKQVSDPKQRPE